MNFFGHAAAACRQRETPGFVLGAMLPDFAAMAGVRVPAVEDAEIAAGMEAHHRTDAVFHGTGTFVALLLDATRTLGARGLRRGSARAVAHVAIELVLDGALRGDGRARAAYGAAMAAAPDGALGRELHALPATDAARWHGLWRRLAALHVPDAYADAAFVAARIAGMLAWRPRLALDRAAKDVIAGWLPGLQAEVEPLAPALLGAVIAADGVGRPEPLAR